MVNIGIIGAGFVASKLISQLHDASSQKKGLNVVAIANSKRMCLSNHTYTPLDLSDWQENLQASSYNADLDRLIEYLQQCKTQHSIIVDCSASDRIAHLYPGWLKLGLSIVTPNKKAFSGSLELFKEIHSVAANHQGSGQAFIFHESTVGAGLPVLSTLNTLVKTGDQIISIEGIFSGTLSFLFRHFSSADKSVKKSFSQIVKEAKDLGFTEPDPRDDLNGMDVARKLIICGRLAGFHIDLSDLRVENIVPQPLQSVNTPQEFMTRLSEYDQHFFDLNKEAQNEGRVLRYVGVIDSNKMGSVQLMKYPASHPFASLEGGSNIIKFTTKYFPNGLIIQGDVAGDSTAFGIFSDLIKVQELVESA